MPSAFAVPVGEFLGSTVEVRCAVTCPGPNVADVSFADANGCSDDVAFRRLRFVLGGPGCIRRLLLWRPSAFARLPFWLYALLNVGVPLGSWVGLAGTFAGSSIFIACSPACVFQGKFWLLGATVSNARSGRKWNFGETSPVARFNISPVRRECMGLTPI